MSGRILCENGFRVSGVWWWRRSTGLSGVRVVPCGVPTASRRRVAAAVLGSHVAGAVEVVVSHVPGLAGAGCVGGSASRSPCPPRRSVPSGRVPAGVSSRTRRRWCVRSSGQPSAGERAERNVVTLARFKAPRLLPDRLLLPSTANLRLVSGARRRSFPLTRGDMS